jgi:hypothetical protein
MPQLTMECSIDGQPYSAEQLERLQYDRQVHVLHEMKRLGTVIQHDGSPLSDDDINLLSPEDARAVSIAARQSYDVEGIRDLFKKQLQASDQMWRDANDAPAGAPPQIASADLTITGLSLDEFRGGFNFDTLQRIYAAINPDHYFAHADSNGPLLMETFGMHGGPSLMYAIPDPGISVPVEREAGYPLLSAGYTLLADGTNPNMFAYHQYKPLEHGLTVRLCAIFPPKTPKVIVDGHKAHMAIEIWEGAKLVAAG